VQSGGVSSLVFLVVIGVWAAYFIQYWVRRRDHLATARSVDQFSESMRVLERRTTLPAAGPSTPGRVAPTAEPLRSSRPQLLLSRAGIQPVTASVDDAAPAGTRPAARARARRNRGLVLLGALSTWLVAIPLVAAGLLGWPYLAVPALALVAALTWVRRSAQGARGARRRPSGTVSASHRGPRSQSRAHDTPTTRPAHQRVAHTRPPGSVSSAAEAHAGLAGDPGEPAETAQAQTTAAEPAAPSAPARPRGELYDLQAIEAASKQAEPPHAAPQPARPLVDEDDIPLTWDPVPVPRPTYTLKARATRPAPAAADLVGDSDTEYAPRGGDLPARQVAGA
jgi:hypothetical protein